MARYFLLVVLAALLSTGSCQSRTAGVTATSLGASPRISVPGLPPPAALRVAAGVTSGVFCFGDDFLETAPHQQVNRESDSSAVFTPSQDDAVAGLQGLAYGVYLFDTTGFTGDGRLRFDWQSTADFNNLWIGLPSPDDTHWDWFPGPADLELEYDTGAVLNGAEEYVVVLCMGWQAWRLNSLRLCQAMPPTITAIAPDGGEAGTAGQFTVTTSGGAVEEYSWYFDGAAAPDTSTAASPSVVFGPAGSYNNASLTVSNQAGSDTLLFQITNTGANALYSAGGTVTRQSGAPYAGCSIDLQGPTPGTAVTDAAGHYEFANRLPGSYVVKPLGGTFTPTQRSFSLAGADETGMDFQETGTELYTIIGYTYVYPEMAGTGGFTVELSGDESRTTESGSFGCFIFDDLPNGNYRVTPDEPGVYFAPEYRDITIAGDDSPTVNFLASLTPLDTYTLSGKVTESGTGQPIAGQMIELKNFWYETTVTAADGSYQFTNVAPASHQIVPADPDDSWNFTPLVWNLVANSDRTDLNFTRSPAY